jgi:hypothetical protein
VEGPLLVSDPDAVVSRSSAPIDRPWRPVLALGALTLVVGVVLTLNLLAVESGMRPPMSTTVCHETDR